MAKVANVQLGKQGLTENFMGTLKDHFNKSQTVKVSVLKSAGRDRELIKKYSEEILENLGEKFNSRILGFTIIVKKWRKAVR